MAQGRTKLLSWLFRSKFIRNCQAYQRKCMAELINIFAELTRHFGRAHPSALAARRGEKGDWYLTPA